MVEQKLRVKPGTAAPIFTEATSSPLAETNGGMSANGAHPKPEATLKEENVTSGPHGQPNEVDEKTSPETTGDEEMTVVDRRKRDEQKLQQQRKLSLIRDCEGVLLVNYDWLDMPNYPPNELLALARRHTEYVMLTSVIFIVIAILAVNEWVPAWVGGTAVGLFFLLLSVWFTRIRYLLISSPSYKDVMRERKKMEFRAIGHIKLLEGNQGLAAAVFKMAPYNSALSKPVFQMLIKYSRVNKLPSIIRSRAHIRLYLLYMLEAEKAYKRLKDDYFSTHRELQSIGVDDIR